MTRVSWPKIPLLEQALGYAGHAGEAAGQSMHLWIGLAAMLPAKVEGLALNLKRHDKVWQLRGLLESRQSNLYLLKAGVATTELQRQNATDAWSMILCIRVCACLRQPRV